MQVLKLPTTKKKIKYFHAAAGFAVKYTWMNVIQAGNYVTWLSLNVKLVNKYFPALDESQQWYVKGLGQSTRSTKEKENNKLNDDSSTQLLIKKEHNIFIKIVNMKETIYTNQTDQFPLSPAEATCT